jgi:hypothetical protein
MPSQVQAIAGNLTKYMVKISSLVYNLSKIVRY